MKKLVKILTLICLVTAFALTLVACSSYGKIEKALLDRGYAVIESSDEADDMQEESDVAVTVHVLSNADSLSGLEVLGANVVIVLEFNTTEDMKEYYEDSNTMQGLVEDVKEDGSAKEFYDSLVEKGYANGNCLVLCVSLNASEIQAVRELVKNA